MTLDELSADMDRALARNVGRMVASIVDEGPFLRKLREQEHRKSVVRWSDWLRGWRQFHGAAS